MAERAGSRGRAGLIIGKFLPLHSGHKQLIDAALARCDRLTVAVFSREAEPIPGHVRAGWLRAEYPGVRVVHLIANLPDPWDEESWEQWVALCRRCAPEASVLFCGEPYGLELARRMGIACELVERSLLPVSGTAIRLDPISHWQHVPVAVRPWLAKKVVLLGAESTGKTTLAARLAAHYGTAWAPEYGREYCELKCIHDLTPGDMLAIAAEQCALEDRMAVQSNGLLICDTDLMATRAWSVHLCGVAHPAIAEMERSRRYDLHLVASPRVGWVDDGTRVCGEQSIRQWFHRFYVDELTSRRMPHMELPPREGDAFALACNVLETLCPSLPSAKATHSPHTELQRFDLHTGKVI